jgi:hypothetical protein
MSVRVRVHAENRRGWVWGWRRRRENSQAGRKRERLGGQMRTGGPCSMQHIYACGMQRRRGNSDEGGGQTAGPTCPANDQDTAAAAARSLRRQPRNNEDRDLAWHASARASPSRSLSKSRNTARRRRRPWPRPSSSCGAPACRRPHYKKGRRRRVSARRHWRRGHARVGNASFEGLVRGGRDAAEPDGASAPTRAESDIERALTCRSARGPGRLLA